MGLSSYGNSCVKTYCPCRHAPSLYLAARVKAGCRFFFYQVHPDKIASSSKHVFIYLFLHILCAPPPSPSTIGVYSVPVCCHSNLALSTCSTRSFWIVRCYTSAIIKNDSRTFGPVSPRFKTVLWYNYRRSSFTAYCILIQAHTHAVMLPPQITFPFGGRT